ncbi:hypothetical protein Tco_1463465 [Tanacetum coccineum]
MLLNLITTMYVPFGIPFDPKRYYKDGVYPRMLLRPRLRPCVLNLIRRIDLYPYGVLTKQIFIRHMALPPRDQRHQYLSFEGLQYTDTDIVDFEERLGRIYDREDTDGAQGCSRFGEVVLDLDTAGALQFQLGEVRRRMIWREFILGISSARDFLGITPSYNSIRDPMLRLCHKLIACSIAGRSQAPKKGLTVIVRDLPVIDMAELGAAVGTPEAVEDAHVVDEGAPAVPAPMQAPQPPPPATRPARTMA